MKTVRLLFGCIVLVGGTGTYAGEKENLPDPPSPSVLWTEEQQQIVNGGDAARGKELAERCIHCHGETGIGAESAIPNLAGQLAAYTYKQLKHYKEGNARNHSGMRRRVKRLNDQQMADIAAWYASLEPATPDLSLPPAADNIVVLVEHGDEQRGLTACAGCHGARGEGAPIDTPAIGGQKVQYFFDTMQLFAQAGRARDVFNSMCELTPRLTRDEVQGLAEYYARLGGAKLTVE